MLFKPHVVLQEMPPELQEAVNINTWEDMIYMAFKIATRFDVLFHREITKEHIIIESDPLPLKKGSEFIYRVILEGFGIIGFTNELTMPS